MGLMLRFWERDVHWSEQRPVTAGTYENTPNDKTFEFYMEKPRSSTVKGLDDPEFCMEMFRNALEASNT